MRKRRDGLDVRERKRLAIERLRNAIVEICGKSADSERATVLLQYVTAFDDHPHGFTWTQLVNAKHSTWIAKIALVRLAKFFARGKVRKSKDVAAQEPPFALPTVQETVLVFTGPAPHRPPVSPTELSPKHRARYLEDQIRKVREKTERMIRRTLYRQGGAEWLCTSSPGAGVPLSRLGGGCQIYRPAVEWGSGFMGSGPIVELACGHKVPITNPMRAPNGKGGWIGFSGLKAKKKPKRRLKKPRIPGDVGDGTGGVNEQSIADAQKKVRAMERAIEDLMPKRKITLFGKGGVINGTHRRHGKRRHRSPSLRASPVPGQERRLGAHAGS